MAHGAVREHRSPLNHPVVEVDDPAPEAPLAQQLESGLNAFGKRVLSTTHKDRMEEEMALVDQSGSHRLGCEFGATHGRSRAEFSLSRLMLAGSNSGLIFVVAETVDRVRE